MGLLQIPARGALIVRRLRRDLHGFEISHRRDRRFAVAQRQQRHRALIEIARPDGTIAGGGLPGRDRLAPGRRKRGDQGARMLLILAGLQHHGAGRQQLAAVFGHRRQFVEGRELGKIMFPAAIILGQHGVMAALQRTVGGHFGFGAAVAEADHEIIGRFGGHRRQLGAQFAIAGGGVRESP